MSTINFENSAMKSSYSLSSLLISETPDKNAMKPKEFNSLKKKRKESTKRLSWGSSASEQKDEFWSAIVEANYNYIMDNQLIDNCQDANCELSTDTRTWSVKEFYAQFFELYSWLNRIQEEIYGNEDNLTDKTLRANCKSKFIKKRVCFNIFTDQGNQLMLMYPELKEEVTWWVSHLSTKWESLETVLKASDAEQDDAIVQRELKCLKNWIRDMENHLQPLSFNKRWSKTEIESKSIEHKVLHKDIENHGKIVNSVVKLCKRTSNNCRNTLNIVTGLERRWHLLFLRSMEWQCHIENLIKKNSALFSNSDSDEGPVKKQPRLSSASPIFKECHNDDVSPLENDIDTTDGIYKGNNENDMMNSQEYESEAANNTFNMPGEDVQGANSNRITSNTGYFYFKHVDTDSDMDKMEQLQAIENEVQTTSETSDEDWTYTANNKEEEVAEKLSSNDKIWKIVQEVEEMVSPKKRTNPTGKPPMNKMLRIKQWLAIDKPDDSCDASSEDDENESQSSEELNESIATYRPQTSLNASCIDLGPASSTPKMRQRYNARGIRGQRPSSIACITQLSKSTRVEHDTQPCSISESAIHKLPLTTKMNSSISMQGNSTSSTVEDSCAMVNEEHNSPLRKKRFKLKKKSSVFRKNESVSPYNNGTGSRDRVGTLVKSGSFSGRSCLTTTCDRQTVSDPAAIPMGHTLDTSTTSGADSDDDKRTRRLPMFKLGAKTNYVMNENRDDSPGKFSINTNEEQASSLCDEAWDNYQEKYSSEAYSEAHDSDAARRLLEFGEDYRTYLGSQSDWSAQSSHLEFSPQFPRKFLPMNIIDSDNEANDLRQLLKDSRDQLKYTENVFDQQQALGIKQYLVNNDLKELMTTCDRHIKCLTPVDKSPEEYSLSVADKKELADLITHWQALKGRINIMQEFRDLQNEILVLKRQFCDIHMPEDYDSITVNTIEELSRDIDLYSAELAIIDDHKKKLQKVNFAVNHFMTENTEYNASSLKSDVSELYRIWYEINNSATERVKRLNGLLQNWQVLETRLDQLRGDLRDDEQTLGVLDLALQSGNFSNKMASSVRDVAKLLSETKNEGCSFSEILTEGSFSDSGISDEGSEHELGKRERRLSAIRRLVRQLEIVMAPDCIARVRMQERLDAAEEELKTLRNKCRSIIVRTAVSAAAPLSETVVATGPGGDPDGESTTTSWFKRAVRAAYISFPIAIIILLLVAYPLEPSCCDNVNNLQMSMNPQLHYVRGPPPI